MKKYISLIIFLTATLVSLFFIYQKLNPIELPKNLVAGSGTIDGDLILLNSKYSARVDKFFVQEGDRVILGQKIAQLQSKEFINRRDALQASIVAQEESIHSFDKTLGAKKLELELLEKSLPNLVTIKENNTQALQNVLKSISLQIKELELNVAHAKKEYKRNTTLYKSKAISLDSYEIIQLKYKTLTKKLETLKVEKQKENNQLHITTTELAMAKDRLSKIEISKQNLLSLQDKLLSMNAQLNALKFQKAEVVSMIHELSIVSHSDGYIIEKVANVGEVVKAGDVIATLSDTQSYYLKLYIDTLNNDKIKLGDKAVIFTDAYPDKPINAKVVNISAKAEFTPKEVSVRSDRIQRVYAIHLKPIKYDPTLKLGTPAIGIVSIDGKNLPDSLSQIPKI